MAIDDCAHTEQLPTRSDMKRRRGGRITATNDALDSLQRRQHLRSRELADEAEIEEKECSGLYHASHAVAH